MSFPFHCPLLSSPANAGGTGRDALQVARQPEESAIAGGASDTTLPGQYKQRTPMYNASTTASPAAPTSPSTTASTPASNGPPAAATASQPETSAQPPTTPQTPTPTPPQPQPKKNLSLTVRLRRLKTPCVCCDAMSVSSVCVYNTEPYVVKTALVVYA